MGGSSMKKLKKELQKSVLKSQSSHIKVKITLLFPLINLYTNNNPLKAIITIVLIVGIITYTTRAFPLAFAFELATPNKNLQVQWWKWILGIAREDSPALDETGEDCDIDQKGSVWYLAGFAGSTEGLPGGSAERDCVISEGKDILIPIFNTICAEITDAGLIKTALGLEENDEIPPSQLKEGLIRCTDFILDHIDRKLFSIDGQTLVDEDLEDFRVVSPQFQIVYPEDNVFEQLPTNVKQKAVAQGYWVLVEDLEPGEHTIEAVSHLSFPEFDFEFQTSVIYHLTIESKQTSSLSQDEINPVLNKLTGNPGVTQPAEDLAVINKLLRK
jgi:hypothetical protein